MTAESDIDVKRSCLGVTYPHFPHSGWDDHVMAQKIST